MDHAMWDHLPLLVRSSSKDSVEYILQTLWRTRKSGLDVADRESIAKKLQLENDSDLDPLLVCLRMLIRRCVDERVSKDEIHRLFPDEVLPELKRLLTLLLQKFQEYWQNDALLNDQIVLPHLKAMTWNMANHNLAEIKLKLENDTLSHLGASEVQFILGKDNVDTMLHSLNSIRDELSSVVKFYMCETSNGHADQPGRGIA